MKGHGVWAPAYAGTTIDLKLRRHVRATHRLRRGRLFPGRVGDMDRRECRPLDVTPVALFGAKLAFGESDPAARQGGDGRAETGKALEHIIVDPADLFAGTDGLAGLRV